MPEPFHHPLAMAGLRPLLFFDALVAELTYSEDRWLFDSFPGYVQRGGSFRRVRVSDASLMDERA